MAPKIKKTAPTLDVQNTATPPIPYAEAQENEVEALSAIFAEDFQDHVTTNAWNKSKEHAYNLVVRCPSDPDETVTLSVKYTATYPKTEPILKLQGLEKFHQRTQERIRTIVTTLPKQFIGGDVFIDAIAYEIQDALEEAIAARKEGTLQSLDAERASAADVAHAHERESREAEARRIAEEEQERQRKRAIELDQQLKKLNMRQSRPASESTEPSTGSNAPEVITFDQPGKISIGNDTQSFTKVTITGLLSRHRTYLGTPNVSTTANLPYAALPLVTVKRKIVQKKRADIIELENVLNKARLISHQNLLNVLTYLIRKKDDLRSEVVLCRQYSDRGSLQDLLEMSSLHTSKARQFTIELLEATQFLHTNGLTHGRISPRTIYLTSHPTLSVKLAAFGYAKLLGEARDDIPSKWRSPDSRSTALTPQKRCDVWDLGIVVVQMFLGLSTPIGHQSPSAMFASLNLSEPFADLLNKFLATNVTKHFSPFDIQASEFFRAECTVYADATPEAKTPARTRHPSGGLDGTFPRRSRHNSSNVYEPLSRYLSDFDEIGRLGKGGFGEVVKARNKIDGAVYAIKKVKQAPQLLDQVLSEVMLLNRLNHPYVVRYYSTWLENNTSTTVPEEAISTTDENLNDSLMIDFGHPSAGGLDFVSSSGYGVYDDDDEDGTDEDEEEEENEVDDDDGSVDYNRGHDYDDDFDPFERGSDGGCQSENATASDTAEKPHPGKSQLQRLRSDTRRLPSTLYIQMELCDLRSLRDVIHKGLNEEDTWRFLRQITEGLAHIHAAQIIHRDLKPDNVFIDAFGNPKIGDFGLATIGQQQSFDKPGASRSKTSGDLTRSIGTALYAAPELASSSGSSYTNKVDMYSLGIIFFEMNRRFSTAMERIAELQKVREPGYKLAAEFQIDGDKASQGKLISWLVAHKPSERPSSAELLGSDLLPVKIEDETLRKMLSGLTDVGSPYHQQLMSALFSQTSASSQRVKALAWDLKAITPPEDPARTRMRGTVTSSLETVFRRHGAEEVHREGVFPSSDLYTAAGNAFTMMDPSGNIVQLSYDMVLPFARQLARQTSAVRCSFSFGTIYRNTVSGGPPREAEEAAFDIVNDVRDEDASLNDAEVVRVVDEALSELPPLDSSTSVSFHMTNGALVDGILDHCRVPLTLQHAVKDVLSRLGYHSMNWTKCRPELRGMGISDTTLDDLQTFDWQETPGKAFKRLTSLLERASPAVKAKCESALRELRQTISAIGVFGVTRKVSIAPLSCYKARLYAALMFKVVLERKKTRYPVAAGGRYDSVIEAHRIAGTGNGIKQGAVGVCITLDTIVSQWMKACSPSTGKAVNFLKDSAHSKHLPKRCDVLVIASGGTEKLRDAGIRIVSSLWDSGISAELSRETSSSPDQHYTFLVHLRHEASTTVRVTHTESEAEDTDIPIPSLVSHLQQELRDRASKTRQPLPRTQSGQHENRSTNVQVLWARHGSKKSNKYSIVADATRVWSEKLDGIKDAPILAIETRDDVLDVIQATRLSDAESWKKAGQSVQLNEGPYLGQVREMLESWRKLWQAGEGVREACVYNFRTQRSIYYDLGA
jgi:translation initiation factor 2-alpha kinase 4